ncbi:MAG: hypothetical protein IJ950_01775 [Helicobacter sp.]|nr:hypothetical protein [Helicobacter sp.]
MFELSFQNLSMICSIACLLVVIVLVVANYFRSMDTYKRFRRFERGIEDLNKEMYKIKKWIKDNELENQYTNTALGSKIKAEVRDALSNGLIKVQRQIEILESDIHKQNDYMEEKTLMLEEKLHELNYMPSNGNTIDEKRINALFRDGWSIDSIAKEMRLGKGEVEFILKLANIR